MSYVKYLMGKYFHLNAEHFNLMHTNMLLGSYDTRTKPPQRKHNPDIDI